MLEGQVWSHLGLTELQISATKNKLQLIIRAHECVMDGFERFAHGKLIALFSVTNYYGTANNTRAILVIGRGVVVVPKLIHPLPPHGHSPETSPERAIDETWMQELNIQRPPTPTCKVLSFPVKHCSTCFSAITFTTTCLWKHCDGSLFSCCVFRMQFMNAENFVVGMVTCAAVVYLAKVWCTLVGFINIGCVVSRLIATCQLRCFQFTMVSLA